MRIPLLSFIRRPRHSRCHLGSPAEGHWLKAARGLACLFLLGGSCILVACEDQESEPKPAKEARGPRNLAYEIVKSIPHDITASTQGLLLHGGAYYESTGGYGTSTLRKVDPKTGKVLKRIALPATVFGEGLALRDDRLYQLEWKSGQGFIYDRETFKHVGEFRYHGEGWGLAWDGKHFILSDGTAFLRFLDPDSFALVRSIKVRNHLGPVDLLNELEFINGKIFANQWFKDKILVIDPATGRVDATLDLAALERPRPNDQDSVLNGIAYDPETRHLHVTGKGWTKMYVLRLQE